VAPSLRKMQSKPSDQGKRPQIPGLWRGCETSVVRHRETLMLRLRFTRTQDFALVGLIPQASFE
jgi:hypothetical protein